MTNPPNPDPLGEQDPTPQESAQPQESARPQENAQPQESTPQPQAPETSNTSAPEPPAAPAAPATPSQQAPAAPQRPAAPATPPAPPAPPAAPQYQAPQQPAQPQQPAAPQYQAPQQPQQPTAPQPPAAPNYAAPAQPQYGQQQFSQPTQPQYGQPVQPQYAAAAPMGQPGVYQQPISPAGPFPPPGPGEPFNGAISPEDLTRPLYGASFSQAVRRYFKSYAKFSGRASRSEYWWVALFTFLVSFIPLVFYIAGAVMLAGASASAYSSYNSYGSDYGANPALPASGAASGLGMTFLIIGLILLFIISLGLLVPSIAIAWRRLHDANFAGPFYFLSLIPYVGGLVLLVFMILGSNPSGRRFDV